MAAVRILIAGAGIARLPGLVRGVLTAALGKRVVRGNHKGLLARP